MNEISILISRLSTVVLMVGFLTSCPETTPPSQSLTCKPTLQPNHGTPGTPLEIIGLPDGVIPIAAEFKDDSQSVVSLALTSKDSKSFVLMPLIFDHLQQQTSLSIVISSATQKCEVIQSTVDALPDPKSVVLQNYGATLLQGLQAQLNNEVTAAGLDPTKLLDDPNTLPTEYLPYTTRQFILEHPENPDSIAKTITGVEDQDLLNQLLFLIFQQASPARSPITNEFNRTTTRGGSLDCHYSVLFKATLANGEDLESCMSLQEDALIRLELGTEWAGALDKFAAFLGTLAKIPNPGTPIFAVVSAISKVVAVTISTASLVPYMESRLLPSKARSLDFVITPATLTQAGQAANWQNVSVIADSEGFSVEGLILSVNLKMVKKLQDVMLKRISAEDQKLTTVVLDVINKSTGYLLDPIKKKLNLSGDLKHDYGRVDITAYTVSYVPTLSGDDVVEGLDRKARSVLAKTPLKEGIAQLTLTVDKKFYGDITSVTKPIKVEGITYFTHTYSKPYSFTVSGPVETTISECQGTATATFVGTLYATFQNQSVNFGMITDYVILTIPCGPQGERGPGAAFGSTLTYATQILNENEPITGTTQLYSGCYKGTYSVSGTSNHPTVVISGTSNMCTSAGPSPFSFTFNF